MTDRRAFYQPPWPRKPMSEEKPTFKVTDRRLFNADGTPRQIEREEEPPQTTQTDVQSSANETTAAPASAVTETDAQRAPARASRAEPTEHAPSSAARQTDA